MRHDRADDGVVARPEVTPFDTVGGAGESGTVVFFDDGPYPIVGGGGDAIDRWPTI